MKINASRAIKIILTLFSYSQFKAKYVKYCEYQSLFVHPSIFCSIFLKGHGVVVAILYYRTVGLSHDNFNDNVSTMIARSLSGQLFHIDLMKT